MVLVIFADTTSPTFSFLLPIRLVATALSAMAYFPFFFLALFFAGSGAVSGCSSRSRRIVRIRARSLRMVCSFFNPSVCPILNWKRRRKFCSFISVICRRSSSLSNSRNFSARIVLLRVLCSGFLAAHHFGGKRQLACRQPERLFGGSLGNAFHLKQ